MVNNRLELLVLALHAQPQYPIMGPQSFLTSRMVEVYFSWSKGSTSLFKTGLHHFKVSTKMSARIWIWWAGTRRVTNNGRVYRMT